MRVGENSYLTQDALKAVYHERRGPKHEAKAGFYQVTKEGPKTRTTAARRQKPRATLEEKKLVQLRDTCPKARTSRPHPGTKNE